ncbi:kinase-like domain-containing protein, partial [Mycena sp. CBHHK59/15]
NDKIYKFYRKETLDKPTAAGGFGQVYCTKRIGSSGESIAVKRIKADVGDKVTHQNVEKEISFLNKMKGFEGVTQIIDVFRTNHTIDIVLEWVPGGTLQTKIEEEDLDEETSRDLVFWICFDVAIIHNFGKIAHRDLKPENILLYTIGDSMMPKVADFGLAKPLTAMKTICGTEGFMAPEMTHTDVCNGETGVYEVWKPYTSSVDSWSMGITVASMLSRACQLIEIRNPQTNEMWKKPGEHASQVLFCLEENGIGPASDAYNFVWELLRTEPERRMTLADTLDHPWLSRYKFEVLNCESAKVHQDASDDSDNPPPALMANKTRRSGIVNRQTQIRGTREGA